MQSLSEQIRKAVVCHKAVHRVEEEAVVSIYVLCEFAYESKGVYIVVAHINHNDLLVILSKEGCDCVGIGVLEDEQGLVRLSLAVFDSYHRLVAIEENRIHIGQRKSQRTRTSSMDAILRMNQWNFATLWVRWARLRSEVK